jgi:hypothetical protein
VERQQQETSGARRDAGEARVAAALAAIQEAQGLIGQATRGLCSVNGMVAEWRRLGKLYEQVRRTWYAVETKRDRLRLRGGPTLDHEPDSHEARWGLEVRA